MTYSVTFKTTLKPNAPTFSDWLTNIDLTRLEKLPVSSKKIPYYLDAVNEFKRLIAHRNLTPMQVVDEYIENLLSTDKGFKSFERPVAVDNDVTMNQVWSSAEEFEKAQLAIKFSPATGFIDFHIDDRVRLTGNGTKFTTEVSVNDVIGISLNDYPGTIGTVLEVISDTELRLHRNIMAEQCCVDPPSCHLYLIKDWSFSVYKNQFYFTFLKQIYDALYVESTSLETSQT